MAMLKIRPKVSFLSSNPAGVPHLLGWGCEQGLAFCKSGNARTMDTPAVRRGNFILKGEVYARRKKSDTVLFALPEAI
jgi:hypothetical protein